MGASAAFDVYVKGAPAEGQVSNKGKLLDCPFSQRVLLTLEEKGVSYQHQYVDEYNIPEWVKDVNEAGKKVPFAKDLEADKWIGDSANIVTYIEQKYPEPKLSTPDDTTDIGTDVFPKFTEFLKAEKGSADEEKAESELSGALQKLNNYLESHGPLLAGDHVCAQCIALAPQLYHTKVATKAIKGWELPKEFSAVHKFLDTMQQRPSWAKTAPESDQVVIDGWKKKLASS
jgi:glutathione S-transferase